MQGTARGLYSLHMFMSWLFNLGKGDHEKELAAFKEVTVWRVSLLSMLDLHLAMGAGFLTSDVHNATMIVVSAAVILS